MQNGMNQMGGGQQGGAGDQGQQDPNKGINNDNYAALGLNVDPNMDWRDIRYRQKVSWKSIYDVTFQNFWNSKPHFHDDNVLKLKAFLNRKFSLVFK